MISNLRVAFFADSYLEVNGVAMTANRLVDFARRRDYPFLCIHAGPQTELKINGSVTDLSLRRSPLAIPLDETLAYDPLFQRHTNRVLRQLMEFKPDVIHITGFNDVSIIGSYLAWKLKLPLLASWHTNVHEFAATRARGVLSVFPQRVVDPIANTLEKGIMKGAGLYYRMPKVILSPNQELIDELGRRTNRVSKLMARGVDADLFTPARRTAEDNIFRIGYVGRLRAEKNVRVLVDVEKVFLDAGVDDFEMLIVGEGTERPYLERHMRKARFTGFLDGERLAGAFANMDVLVFPSETDTFGNVVTEGNASGVPAIVSDKGGPKFIVREGETGYIAKTPEEFARYAMSLYRNRDHLTRMKQASRESALSRSWDSIFESVYDAYEETIRLSRDVRTPASADVRSDRE